MSKHKAKSDGLLPYPVIMAASGGDVDAINVILKHFGGYITILAAKRLYGENGEPHLYVDEGLRRRLETKLITKILTFDAA